MQCSLMYKKKVSVQKDAYSIHGVTRKIKSALLQNYNYSILHDAHAV